MTATAERIYEAPATDRAPLPLDSRTGRIFGEWRMLFILGRLLILQVMHPMIGAAVGAHSTYRTDPWGRLIRSLNWTHGILFGGPKAVERADDLRQLHKPIGGVDEQGRRYHAWNAEAYHWVHATTFDSFLIQQSLFVKPLTKAEQEELYAEYRQAGRLLGIKDRDMPPDLDSFRVWYAQMLRTGIENHPTAHDVLATFGSSRTPSRWIPAFAWRPFGRAFGWMQTLVTVGTLPPEVRDLLGLTWTVHQERQLRAFAALVRFVFRLVPPWLRYMPTARAAIAEARRAERDVRNAFAS